VKDPIPQSGYVVIKDAIDAKTREALRSQLSPYLQGELMGRNDFEGFRSERADW
jgi:hypothetical protein